MNTTKRTEISTVGEFGLIELITKDIESANRESVKGIGDDAAILQFEEGDEVTCTWTPTENFQSWISTLHGGIQATLLDETCGWLVSRKCQLAGMTTQLNVKYKKPVLINGTPLEVRTKIKEIKRSFVLIDCQLLQGGEICSTAEATFFCFSKEKSINDFHFQPFEVEE